MEAEICAFAPSDWEIRSVEDVCKRVTSGGTPSRTRPDFYVDGSWPWVKTQELQDSWIEHTEEKITDEAVANSSAKVLPANTILLAMYGATVGQLGILRTPMTCNQACCAMIVDPDKADFRYLYHHLRYSRTQLKSLATGAAQQNLSGALIKSLHYPFPPLSEQKRIAGILGALDDKIELNRKMNATLEAMARALFQSWFVDFDPVRRNIDRKANSSSQRPSNKSDSTAQAYSDASFSAYDHLFPDEFQDSELGHIPKGWEVRSLDKTAYYLNGLALQKFPPGDGPTLPVIKIAQLRKGDSIGADRCNNELPPNYIVHDGDVLFSWSGSLEVEIWCGGIGALNQHIFKVSSIDFPKWFYYLWTLYHLEGFRLIAAGKATTMGHIQRVHLTSAKVLIPSLQLLDAMTRTMSPLIDQLIANRTQTRTLSTLRDTLLPKLLGGELSVSQ